MNLRVINEKIESLALSCANKAEKGVKPSAEESTIMKPPSKPSQDQILGFQDRSTVGVELVQVRHAPSSISCSEQIIKGSNGIDYQKDCTNSKNAKPNEAHNSGGEWAQMLDMLSRRKTQVLAPENLESMWTKGRNYKKKEHMKQVASQVERGAFLGSTDASHHFREQSNSLAQNGIASLVIPKGNTASSYDEERHLAVNLKVDTDSGRSTHHSLLSDQYRTEDLNHEEVETDSEGSYQTEDDESTTVTGLDSPGTRVWDSKNKTRAVVQHIRHPLETSDLQLTKKKGKVHVRHPRTMRTSSGRKRPRSSNPKVPIWQEVERTSFLLGEGHDILYEAKCDSKTEELSDDPEVEIWGRAHNGETASSSLSSISTSESCISSLKSPENSVLADSFLKLRCEVIRKTHADALHITYYSFDIMQLCDTWMMRANF